MALSVRLPAYDLTGRTAFVTGAASGIGRACAELLAEAGATVHCADRDEPGLAETARRIAKTGGAVTSHTLDVTDRSRLREAITSAGRLDILVASAGIMHSSSVLDTTDEDLDRVLAVNFKGVLHTCQEAARTMLATAAGTATGPETGTGTATGPETGTGTATDPETGTGTSTDPSTVTDTDTGTGSPQGDAHGKAPRPAGSIVTVASGAVDSAGAGLLCYSASKAAVVQLTKTLATEMGPHGIRVNAVAPGWIRTPMTDRHDASLQHSAEAVMRRITPLGRVGEPEDVAHAVLHLVSDAAAFTTGQILRPNGGVAMPW
ncbi:SDR family NAD(P)-dependent oxidoreductase [Streptomyces sp. NPDC091272]|uniref:SDR family NAD(P)-dependent oxidoreductase n=1 Tax=Streptomyces sp. NPDC091272 TaxID=3365981 RepID=UPI0037F10EE7